MAYRSVYNGSVDAYIVDEFNISPNKINIADLKGKEQHFRNIYFPLLQDSEIENLIGIAHTDLLKELKELRKRNLNKPVAVRPSLGSMLIGCCNAEVQKQ